MPCECIDDVDLDIFRGVFACQWLRGEKHHSQEQLFFCTSCGPACVQEGVGKPSTSTHSTLNSSGKSKTSKPWSGGAGSATTTPTSATPEKKSSLSSSSKSTNIFKKFFSTSTSSKTPTKGEPASPGKKKNKEAFSASATKQETTSNGGVLCSVEQECPVTPRTEQELYLCVTCGACMCREHAGEHYRSRSYSFGGVMNSGRGSDDTSSGTGGTERSYPFHSMFVAVPSYISSHPGHPTQETSWHLCMPTVTVKELDEGKVDLTHPIEFYKDFERICDATAVCSGADKKKKSANSSTMPTRVNSFMNSGGRLDETGERHDRSNANSLQQSGAGGYHSRTLSLANVPLIEVPAVRGGTCTLSPPVYHCTPEDRWSYLLFCDKCNDRKPIHLDGRHCDNDIARHRHFRRLGQLVALLGYFLLKGVKLEVPIKYELYRQRRGQRGLAAQQKQQKALNMAEMQRVGKSTEATATDGAVSSVSPMMAPLPLSPSTNNTYGGTNNNSNNTAAYTLNNPFASLSSESVHDILRRAALCGFTNTGYFCYYNSILQCVLRCSLFARPLLLLNRNHAPGNLSLSVHNLLHHLDSETSEDIRNYASFSYIKQVHKRVCDVNALFKEDEQQDAQELLITLLNGVADEYDKGKSEAEKKVSRRISFEGTLKTEVTCSQCRNRVPREEMFMSISIPIEKSITEGLASLFRPAKLTGKDRYACEQCFKKLNSKAQQQHNELAEKQAQEIKKIRAAGKKVDKELEEHRLYANCVYHDAEVQSCISHLGGSLAVHLLRFHYDMERQDFIKVNTPVSIPTKIDLTPYVSAEVRGAYERQALLAPLVARFPTLSPRFLDTYMRAAGDDVSKATAKLLQDGYSTAEVEEPSPSATPTTAGPPARLAKKGQAADHGSSTHLKEEGNRIPCDPEDEELTAETSTTASVTTATGTRAKSKREGAAAAGEPPITPEEVMELTKKDFDPFAHHRPRHGRLERELVGIVSHRGSLHGGHYIAYVRSLAQPRVWFRCDDEDVDVVDEKYVLDHEGEVYVAFYE